MLVMLICFIFVINFYQVVIKVTAKQFTLSERLALNPAFRLTGKRSRASGVPPETVCPHQSTHYGVPQFRFPNGGVV
ncbi:MAG: hypothetical protein AB1441_06405, partial [Bacillota bacterium]